jgi:hypothetical protein
VRQFFRTFPRSIIRGLHRRRHFSKAAAGY